MSDRRREPAVLLAVGAVLLALSGLHPHDRFTWLLEIAPILIGVPVLVGTYHRFPLTPLVYRLILVHACILMLGGHYTYAEVPLGEWMKVAFGFTRNNYDRIGRTPWCAAAGCSSLSRPAARPATLSSPLKEERIAETRRRWRSSRS
jgi:uncharacterized membrane protein YjdF